MGTVYRATQLSLNRVVALKLLAAELSDDSGFRTRFEREGQLQAGLDHQNIVTVYEAGQTEHGLFLAMRLIDGPTLKDLIVTRQLDPRRALRILAQVAQALDEAHAAGLIHRDIKPQNILIGKGDHTYLADFGLIKAPDEAGLTGTGQFLGTIDYVAPEQIQGDPATAASDCYSLCAVLYECLSGQVPFPRNNEAATLHAHVMAMPEPLSEQHPELPPALDEVIASGMAKDPDQRPASATELIRAAASALASARAGAPETRISRPDGHGSQSTRIPGAGAPVAAVTVAAGTTPAAATKPAAAAPAAATAPAASTRAAGSIAAAGSSTAAPAAPGRPARASGAALAVALVLGAAAIVAGFLIGHSGKTAHTEPLSSSAALGHLELRYPSSWHLNSTGGAVPGILLANPTVLTAPPPAAGTLTAGEVTDSTGPTLLPAAFRALVQGGVPASRPVTLGGTQAASYPALRLNGQAGTVSVYAVPTTAGVATIACSSPTASSAFQAQCGRVAASLRLIGTTAFPLGPNAAYARGLSASLARLAGSVRAPLAALQAAGTPTAQAAAAGRLAQAYTTAAGDLGRLTVSPSDGLAHARALSALRQLAAGYASAAAAARTTNARAYTGAGRQIAAGSGALSAALRDFSALGYKVSAP